MYLVGHTLYKEIFSYRAKIAELALKLGISRHTTQCLHVPFASLCEKAISLEAFYLGVIQ